MRQQGGWSKVRVDLPGFDKVPAKLLSHFALALRGSENVKVELRGAPYPGRERGCGGRAVSRPGQIIANKFARRLRPCWRPRGRSAAGRAS